MTELRHLVCNFNSLPFHSRVEIIEGYGLKWDDKKTDQENFQVFFKHIGEKNLFKNLEERIKKYA